MHFHFLSGPRRAKKVLFLFLQKLLWHFYSIQIVFLYVFHGIQRTESWCCKAVNRWSYIIIISEKRLFLELRLLAYYYLYYLLLPLSPFSVLSKKFSRQPKKISRFYFFASLLAWHLCGLVKRLRCSSFFVSAEVFWRYFLPL